VEPSSDRAPGGWATVVAAADLAEGRPTRASLGEDEIFLFRRGEEVFALANRCTHQGAPLSRGRVSGTGATLAVTCPLHGSMFRLADGRVLRGPAMRPVASYEARIVEDRVEVRPAG
jgi:nitrite reductase/ring-hydroxylating ferredoxin subunit